MKNQIMSGVSYLGQKLGIYKFTGKYSSDYPRLVRVFNTALPITMVVAVVFAFGLASWQIVSLAKPGEVKIVLPESSSTKGAPFHARVIFKTSQDRKPYNIVFKLDGRVIESRVSPVKYADGDAIKENDDPREYNFRSGVGGANQFNHDLLTPGEHTLRVEAKTGSTVGEGANIDADNVNFTVANVNNLAALGEDIKTFNASQLPLKASARSAGASLPGLPQKLLASAFPKASAHANGETVCQGAGNTGCRHGGLDVFTKRLAGTPLPGIQITISHPNQHVCDGGNTRVTNGNGEANWRGCGVSNRGEDSARWTVTVQTPTPEGLTLPVDHSPLVDILHNQNRDWEFVYHPSTAPDPGPAPGAPASDPEPAPEPVYNYAPDDGPLVALTSLSANSATVDVFGMQMADNNAINYLAEVAAYLDGAKVSSTNNFTIHASQSGLVLPLNTNIDDGKDHTLAFVATNKNQKSNTLNIKLTARQAPAPGGGTGTGGTPAPDEPPQTNNNKGSLAVTVYAHTISGQRLDKEKDARVGAAYITTHNIGSAVGQCDRENGLTANGRENKSNFGRIHFKDCPAAIQADNDHAKKYRVTMTVPNGFSEAGKVITREVTVKKDRETEVSFIAIGSNSNTIKFDEPASQQSTGGAIASGAGNTPFPETGSSASGIMLLYSEQGRYDRAMIAVNTAKGPTIGGVPNTKASCGDKVLAEQPNQWVIVELPNSSSPLTLRCSASSFFVNFFRPGQSLNDRGPQNNNPRVSPSITANHCTYVEKKGITRVARIGNDGQCPVMSDLGISPNRLETKLSAKYTPFPIIIGQSYTYEHELEISNSEYIGHDVGMSPVECAGDINIIHVPLNDPGRKYPLRYWYDTNARKGRCTFKQQVSADFSARLFPKKEQLKLVFDGNTYLLSSTTTIDFNRINR